MSEQFQQTAVLETVADAIGTPRDAFPSNEQPTAAVGEVLPGDPQLQVSDPNIAKTIEEQVAEAIARLTITHQDVVIAIMGITGVGKSKFISYLTTNDIKVGHGMKSCTAEVDIFPCAYKNGRTIYLVDTPGFNDTTKSDAQTLEYVSVFFSALYSKKIMLAGLIYLHRISDNRMEGSSLLNLEVFEKLVGGGALPNVVLATTMWDTRLTIEAVQEATDREEELMTEYWADMLHKGSKVFRQDDGLRSAMRIIDYLMALGGDGVVTEIARELIDKKLTYKQTGAGKVIRKELLEVEERFATKIANNERRHARAIKEGQLETARKLEEQHDIIVAQQEKHKEEMKIMDRTFTDSQNKLQQAIESLTQQNAAAARTAIEDARKLKAVKDRGLVQDQELKSLRDKSTQSEDGFKKTLDRLQAERKQEKAEHDEQMNALIAQNESTIPKKRIGATILGVATMVAGALILQPAVVLTGAAMAGGGGGLSIAQRAMK